MVKLVRIVRHRGLTQRAATPHNGPMTEINWTTVNPYVAQDRAEFARQAAADADERERDWWDSLMPGWDEAEIDPEQRDTVDYSDVKDPEGDAVRVLAPGHVMLVPGAHSDPWGRE